MNSKETSEAIRDLTSEEVGETAGGVISMTGIAVQLYRMFKDWQLIGCGVDEDGRTYCDYSVPKP